MDKGVKRDLSCVCLTTAWRGRGKLALALKRNVREEPGRRCYAVCRPVLLLPGSQTPSANPLYLSALPLLSQRRRAVRPS